MSLFGFGLGWMAYQEIAPRTGYDESCAMRSDDPDRECSFEYRPNLSPNGAIEAGFALLLVGSGIGLLSGRRTAWRVATTVAAALLVVLVALMVVWFAAGGSHAIGAVAVGMFLVPISLLLLVLLYFCRRRLIDSR